MSAISLHESAVELLTRWTAPDAEQDCLRHTYLAFLAAAPDACLRANVAGHLTASAVVFDPSLTHVLLTLHPRVGKWVQLGGHCEASDLRITDAALREAREESGTEDITIHGGLARLHTHPITCSLGVPTRHLDMQFATVAGAAASTATAPPVLPPIVRSDESVDLRWWPVDELPADTDRTSVQPLITQALALLRGSSVRPQRPSPR
ncbi:MAG: NUDIX domain-containing protein [Gordonia sp. (in: high G+C Gram-positive bacteria)]